MSRKVRSARGEMVDFDLITIKQEIASTAAPLNVSNREEFMENRTRRRSTRKNPIQSPLEVGEVVETRDTGREVTAMDVETPVTVEQEVITPLDPVVKPARPIKK